MSACEHESACEEALRLESNARWNQAQGQLVEVGVPSSSLNPEDELTKSIHRMS